MISTDDINDPEIIESMNTGVADELYQQEICGFCKNFTYSDEFPTQGECTREGLKPLTDSKCFWFSESTRNKFIYFWFNEWNDDLIYFTTDFTDKFAITRHLSRHYLLDVLTYEEAKCVRAMISNRGYYLRRTPFNTEQLQRYTKAGLLSMDS